MKKPVQLLRSWIPEHVSSRTVLEVMDFLRIVPAAGRQARRRHYVQNSAVWQMLRHTAAGAGGLIENQHGCTGMVCGQAGIPGCGCEIIACYNVCLLLGLSVPGDFPGLIRQFERYGLAAGGWFGAPPKAIHDYFLKRGRQVRMTLREADFDRTAADSRVLVVTVYNDRKDIGAEIHTYAVSVEETAQGRRYIGHNVTCDGRVAAPAESLTALIRRESGGRAGGICCIGIS